MTDAPRNNAAGAAWLLADMSLNIWALSIVKAMGLGFHPSQIVFLRAATGLLLIAPWVWARRDAFRGPEHLPLHLLRVALSAVTLTASFYAISRVPLALFTAVNFTRPVVSMLMAAVLLREVIGGRAWAAAAVAFLGVAIAMNPEGTGLSPGFLALGVVVLTGSGAVIATRALRAAPPVVMMAFYTGGLAVLSLPIAAITWTPIEAPELGPLLAVGIFSQAAQFCFLRAHFHGEARMLFVLGYLSLPLSVAVGTLVFGEAPSARFYAGAALVIVAAALVAQVRKHPH